jgi:hypothetical protein
MNIMTNYKLMKINSHFYGGYKKIQDYLNDSPTKIFLIGLALGTLLVASIVYFATQPKPINIMTITYECTTLTDALGNPSCHKFKTSPPPLAYVKKMSNQACPVRKPSNCP